MRAGRVAQLAALLVLIGSGVYLVVYLYRWEWNRALIAGVFFLIAEVGLGIALMLQRLGRVEEQLSRAATTGAVLPPPTVSAEAYDEMLGRIQETAPQARDHFSWLRSENQGMGVFVPVLMGAGVIASALAWLVERLARATAQPVLERGLAARLTPLAWPTRAYTEVDPDPLDLLTGPTGRPLG
ncbi:MAG TPA: hypothetical protein VHA34_06575 [Actinomycetes bacterium]|nr:hypothetical protein [Actinomycetes bacterium]